MINIPKLWLANSFSLVHFLIDKDYSLIDYENLQVEVKPFEQLLNIHQEKLLTKIVELTGIPWQRTEIPIYIVPDKDQKSFAFPLVLVWRNNPINRLLALTHELVHINMLGKEDSLFVTYNSLFKRSGENSEVIDWLIVKTLISLGVYKEKKLFEKEFTLWFERSENMKETLRKIVELEAKWDPQEKKLVEYLQGV